MIRALSAIRQKWERRRDTKHKALVAAEKAENAARQLVIQVQLQRNSLEQNLGDVYKSLYCKSVIDVEVMMVTARHREHLKQQLAETNDELRAAAETLGHRTNERSKLIKSLIQVTKHIETLETRIAAFQKASNSRRRTLAEEETLETWHTVSSTLGTAT